jgi:predicted helicase
MKEKDLKISESKQLILATYSMAAEALDIKSLTTLILATPKTDIVQASGRIMRQPHEQPLIIDIVDTHDLFVKQFAKRKKYYHANNYQVITTTTDLYNRFSNKFSIKIKNRESIDTLHDIWKPLNKNGRSRKTNPIQKSELEDTDLEDTDLEDPDLDLTTQLPKCLISLD